MSELIAKKRVNVYSVGMCYASVCAPQDMERDEVERQTNQAHPTGVGPWHIADEPFHTGEANPHDAGCGNHWLLVC